MLPEELMTHETLAALEAWDAEAITAADHKLGETLAWIRPAKIVAVCQFLRDRGFERVSGITAIDRYPVEPRFEVLYLLHSISRNERIKLKVGVSGDNPEVDSVVSVWAGANWYEREVFDLFGVKFRNHPDLTRILMPDTWEGYPLRKDYPTDGYKYDYMNE